MKKISSALLLLIFSISVYSQDCDTPIQVCFNNPVDSISNASSPPASSGLGCITPDNTVFFSVTTNDLGGDLNIAIDYINCLDTLTNGDSLFTELEAVLFSASDQNVCNQNFWNPIECYTSSDNGISINATNLAPATTYYVMVDGADSLSMGPGQCEFSIDATGPAIENDFDAGPDFEIEFGENVLLQPTGFGDSLMWSPPSGLVGDQNNPNPTIVPNPSAMPSVTTTYTLSTLIDGCYVSDTMTVVVLPIIVPHDIFTPNDDGIYDTWDIDLINRYPKADIKVFSRWGQTIFRSIGYNTPWDGTFNNSRVPAATYYYVIKLNDSRFNDEDNLVTGSIAIVY